MLLLALGEVGFRSGLRLFVAKDEPRKGQIGGIQGAVLGMLALLLGFTFSIAVGRYETRRDLVVKEANAIGTTYLRASFLPEAHAKAVEDLLRRYTDARLSFDSAGSNHSKIAAAEDEAARLQRELWQHTVAAEGSTLADDCDIHQRAQRNDRPRCHSLERAARACARCGVVASRDRGRHRLFRERLRRRRQRGRTGFSAMTLPLLIAVVITLIADFDRPRQGLIAISEQPLLDLKQSLQRSQP